MESIHPPVTQLFGTIWCKAGIPCFRNLVVRNSLPWTFSEETFTNSCGCDSLRIEYFASDFSDCIDCGLQCIYITGSTSISGGETEGADVVVTYTLNGDTLTAGRADWTGEVDLLDCFDAEDELVILQAQAFLPSGGSGSASADAWLVSNPGISDTTQLLNKTCEISEVGVVIDTLLAVSGCDSLVMTTTELFPLPEVFTWDQIVLPRRFDHPGSHW